MINLIDLLSEAQRIAMQNSLGYWLGSRLIIAIPSRGAYAGIVQGIRPEKQLNTLDAVGNIVEKLPPTGNEYYMPEGSILINIAKAISPNGDLWIVGYTDPSQIYTTSNLTILKNGSGEWWNALRVQGFSLDVIGVDPNIEVPRPIVIETYPIIPTIPEGYTGALQETQINIGGNIQTITVPYNTPTESVVINGSRVELPTEEAKQFINSGVATAPIQTTVTALKPDYRISLDTIEKDVIATDTWVFAGGVWNHVVNGKTIETSNNTPNSVVKNIYPSLSSTVFESGIPITQILAPKTESSTSIPEITEIKQVDDVWASLTRSDYYNIPNWLWIALIALGVIGISLGVKIRK